MEEEEEVVWWKAFWYGWFEWGAKGLGFAIEILWVEIEWKVTWCT